MLWRNEQTRVSLRWLLHELLLWFDVLSESVMLWIGFSKNHFNSFKKFLNFWFGAITFQLANVLIKIHRFLQSARSSCYKVVYQPRNSTRYLNLKKQQKNSGECVITVLIISSPLMTWVLPYFSHQQIQINSTSVCYFTGLENPRQRVTCITFTKCVHRGTWEGHWSWPLQSTPHRYSHSNKTTLLLSWPHPRTFLLADWTVGLHRPTRILHPRCVLWSWRQISCWSKSLCQVNRHSRFQKEQNLNKRKEHSSMLWFSYLYILLHISIIFLGYVIFYSKGSNPKPRHKHISPLTYPKKEVTVESWAKQPNV